MEEMNENWENCCPLCMEEMDSTDRQLKPCRCGYQICVWCWNHIMEMAEKDSTEGRCPACRTPYDREKIVSTAVRLGETNDKKQKPGKAKTKASEGRKNLSNVRVIQRNLVYVVGIPAALADEETLERKEYFGQYGKILKISVSKTGGHNPAMSSVSVYVTYVKEEDAMRCIQSVNGYALDGKTLKACFGTTKYCNAWLKHMPCNNPDCLYLHDEGTREDSFTKEEMLAKYGSKNQHFHDLTHPPQRRTGVGLPPPIDTSFSSNSSVPQNAATFVGSAPKTVPLVMNLSKSSSLPAAASWCDSRGSRPSPSRPGSGRTTGSPATKLKTGAGFMNLGTVSESCTSGQCVSNHEGTKHAKASNTEVVHISLSGAPRLVERNHSSAETSGMIQAETFPSVADDMTADPRKLFDGLPPHRKSFASAEITDHAFVTAKDMKIVDHSSTHNFADAEESTVTKDSFAGERLTRTVPTQDACLKSPTGLLTPSSVESTLTDQEQGGSELYSSFQLPSMDCNSRLLLYPDVELSSRKLENALQQEAIMPVETHSVPDKSGFQRPSDAANAFFRLDHPTTEAHEDSSCNWPFEDNWSSSVQCVNNDEPPPSSFLQDETTLQSNDSLLAQKTNCKIKADDSGGIQKASINGLSEHELISDMFSRSFDLWSDGNPQDLAQLLFDGKNVVLPSTSALQKSATMWKPSSGSKQSRFHFARQDEINEQTFCANKLNIRPEHDQHLWSEKNNKLPNGNILTCLNEVSVGKSSHPMNSKSPMMAPPGFSSVRPSAIAPPGFSHLKATDLRRSSDVIQDHLQIVTPTSGLNHLEATDNSADVEFIDPAIMAVGKGKLPASSRTTDPFLNSPLSALLSQTGPLFQQSKPTLDFEPVFQAHQDRPYRSYGYSNQDLDVSSSSLFHSSFNDAISQSMLMGQYHDGVLNNHVVMPESVYANGAHGASKPRFQHSSSDDWSRLSDVNRIGQQSVSDAVGRLAISQLSLNRAYQNRLEELSLSKDLSSKYYGDAAIPTGYDEQGPLSSAKIGRYF